MISQLAFRMYDIVLSWQILEATHSAFWVGLVAFARGLPLLIWSPLTGILADRIKRQQIMIVALIFASVVTAGLALLATFGNVLPWHIIVASFLIGSAFTLYGPAHLALLPSLIPGRIVLNASSIEYSSTRLMGFFGAMIAGALVSAINVSSTLMVQLVLFGLATLAFARIRVRLVCSMEKKDEYSGLLHHFKETLAYLRDDQPLLMLVLLGLVMVPIGLSYQKMMPVFVRDTLGAGSLTLGVMMGVFNLGAALTGFAMAAVRGTFRKGHVMLMSSITFSCGLVLFVLVKEVMLALVFSLVLGLIAGVYLVLSNMLFQTRSPDILRGRVISVWALVWGLAPFGYLALGAVAEQWGVTTAIGASGVLCMLCCIGMMLRASPLRQL